MNICFIGKRKSPYYLELKNYCEEKGYKLSCISAEDIYIEITKEKDFNLHHRLKSILDYDKYILCGPNGFYTTHAKLLVNYLLRHNKEVINTPFVYEKFKGWKLDLVNKNINIFPYVVAFSLKTAKDILIDYEHPIKMLINGKTHINSDDWTESYDILLSHKPIRSVVIEKRLNNTLEYLIYIVDGNIEGVIQKRNAKNTEKTFSYRDCSNDSNIEDVRQFSQKIFANLEIRFGRVDLVEVDGEIYVRNVYSFPKFQLFNKITNKNFPRIIYEKLI